MPTVPAPEKQMTRFEAQRKLGLFAPLDFTCLGLIVVAWITMAYWAIFGSPAPIHLIAAIGITITITQVWLIVLVYRVLVFVLDLGAEINLMPESAARIVAGYYEGRAK